MFRKIALTTTTILATGMVCLAQIKPLDVGDTFPNLILDNVINHTTTQIDTDSLIGKKIVLIDFWSTGCGSCIKMLPKLDSLQRKFADEIMILPVATQPKHIIETFWKRREYTESMILPTVTADTTLKAIFPHLGVPHVVWINKQGKVEAITGSKQVSEENLKKLINKPI